MMLKRFYSWVSNDVGIDLGTANTLVYLRGHGIIINEPSVVAVNQKTGRVVAVGVEAKQMLGRTPRHITAIRPLVEGVISDFEITEEMLTYLLNKVQRISKKLIGPRVVVGVPCGITNVEARAVWDATKNAGAREVHIIEEPMAAAIGIRMPIKEPVGSMVVDIGGGTTDIAVISLGGIVTSRNSKIAGDRLNKDVLVYIKEEFKLLVGERTAENVKIAIGAVVKGESKESIIRGRDLMTGLPREVILTDTDIREAIMSSIHALTLSIREVLEATPPEIVADVMHRGIMLTGGGALLKGLAELLQEELRITIHLSNDPLTAVARGTGIVLEDIESYADILFDNEHVIPTTT